MNKFYNYNSRGFTLIEVLISVFITGMIALALGTFLSKGMDVWFFHQEASEIAAKANEAIDRMSREIRLAVRQSITTADSNTIEFKLDVDNDGDNETINYNFNNTANAVERTQGVDTYVLTNKATNLTFEYYDKNDNSLATPVSNPNDIRQVRITLKMEGGYQVTSDVYLLNYKQY